MAKLIARGRQSTQSSWTCIERPRCTRVRWTKNSAAPDTCSARATLHELFDRANGVAPRLGKLHGETEEIYRCRPKMTCVRIVATVHVRCSEATASTAAHKSGFWDAGRCCGRPAPSLQWLGAKAPTNWAALKLRAVKTQLQTALEGSRMNGWTVCRRLVCGLLTESSGPHGQMPEKGHAARSGAYQERSASGRGVLANLAQRHPSESL